jgi:hypothetical protein
MSDLPVRKNQAMIQLLGILIILDALVASVWWLAKGYPSPASIIILCSVACVVGLAFVFNERGFDLALVGKTKFRVAAQKAVADANEIAKIRARVENQSATLDLAVTKAAEAERVAEADAKQVAEIKNRVEAQSIAVDSAIKKATDLEQVAKQLSEKNLRAEESLSRMEEINAFMTLVTKAQNDDRSALNQLLLRYQTKGPLHDTAVRIIEELVLDLTQTIRTNPPVNWKIIGVDPQSATLDELRTAFWMVARAFQPAYLRDVWAQNRFPKAERLQFLYDVIGRTNSIRTLQAACSLMDKEAKLGQNFLRAESYQQWWGRNKPTDAAKESQK